MAYNKRTWANGNVVGAVDLNRMEDGIEDAFGYTYTSTRETLFEGEVTTVASNDDCAGEINYSEVITADTIYVTFNGTGYECNVLVINSFYVYGGATASGSDYSQYPFAVDSSSEYGTLLHTETAGTYSLKIEALVDNVEVSESFKKAVKSISNNSKFIVGMDTSTRKLDKTWQEIYDAMNQGQSAVVRFFPVGGITELPIINVSNVDFYSVTVITPPSGTETTMQMTIFNATSTNDYPSALVADNH